MIGFHFETVKMKLSSLLRATYRAPIALGLTIYLHYTGIRIPQWFHRGPQKRYHNPTISRWGKLLAQVMGVRIHKVNEQPGEMGDIIVANHMGFLDVLVLLTFFPAVFIIKHEMRRVPFFGKCLEDQGHVFVQRGDATSRRAAGHGLLHVLERGDRIIVFPEGQASPGAARLPFKPFSFVAAQRLDKKLQACVIDYLPDREALKWDIKRSMLPQLIELAGRKHTDVSIEFFPPEPVTGDPGGMAARYKDVIQARLEEHDRQRSGQGDGGPCPE